MIPTAAILAGGLATRLYPITRKIPKSLVQVAGKPFIEHQLELLKRKGIDKVVVCAGYLGDQIREHLEKGRPDMSVHYSFDGPQLLGTGGALQKALPLLGETFLVVYGDSYLDTDYGKIAAYFDQQGKKGLMTLFKNENRWDRSNVRFEGGRILEYGKKSPNCRMKHIDYGLSIFRRDAVAGFATGTVRWDLSLLFQRLIEQDELIGYEVSERFYEIGSAEGLVETCAYLEPKNTGLEGRDES